MYLAEAGFENALSFVCELYANRHLNMKFQRLIVYPSLWSRCSPCLHLKIFHLVCYVFFFLMEIYPLMLYEYSTDSLMINVERFLLNEEPAMSSGDWRAQLPPDSRQKNVDKL